MIESVPHKSGAGRAKAICDDCGRSEIVPCAYVGNANASSDARRPKESQARAKAISMGWAYVKNKLRCPSCEAKRKVVKMEDVKKAKAEPDRQPTRDEKRKIMDMLGEVYDTDNEQYLQGDTDDTVAEVLGVMPGWVADLRDEFFGPAGSNEDMASLGEDLAKWMASVEELVRSGATMIELGNKKLAEGSVMAANLEKIKKAVGDRTLKKAGVK